LRSLESPAICLTLRELEIEEQHAAECKTDEQNALQEGEMLKHERPQEGRFVSGSV